MTFARTTDEFERAWRAKGFMGIAGVDEVGRGPLAGPVMTAAVVVPEDAELRKALREVVGDSKQLTLEQRVAGAALVREVCRVGVGAASVAEIDEVNIRQATFLAMRRAVEQVQGVDAVLVDGRDFPFTGLGGEAMIKGDARELCIACASVVAKVTRDALMAELAKQHPHYGWEINAGYGVPVHLAGLETHGVTVHHRLSFAPVRTAAERFGQLGGRVAA